jgi:hypothetical protein
VSDRPTLRIRNLQRARFECTFGRGCDGICCREGRPPVYSDEAERIDANLPKLLPLMRQEAQAVVAREGFLSRHRRFGQPLMRVAGGWCVFFNRGCVLHAAGASEGDKFRYKPSVCALFPLENDAQERWHVRQKNYRGEKWNLSCLDPATSSVPAAESLGDEIAFAERLVIEGDADVELAVAKPL